MTVWYRGGVARQSTPASREQHGRGDEPAVLAEVSRGSKKLKTAIAWQPSLLPPRLSLRCTVSAAVTSAPRRTSAFRSTRLWTRRRTSCSVLAHDARMCASPGEAPAHTPSRHPPTDRRGQGRRATPSRSTPTPPHLPHPRRTSTEDSELQEIKAARCREEMVRDARRSLTRSQISEPDR